MFGAARRVLVAYYSLTGNTARVGRDLAKALGADLESIRDEEHGAGVLGYFKAAVDAVRETPAQIAAPAHDPGNYSLVIVATPVWAGKMTPAVRTYLQNLRANRCDVAFVITSGDTGGEEIVPPMERVCGHTAVASAAFSASHLSDRAVYEERLAAFVAATEQSHSLAAVRNAA
jgi:hypothetical protein